MAIIRPVWRTGFVLIMGGFFLANLLFVMDCSFKKMTDDRQNRAAENSPASPSDEVSLPRAKNDHSSNFNLSSSGGIFFFKQNDCLRIFAVVF
jgi:hypothetical protein